MFILENPITGKQLRISRQKAMDVFGVSEAVKKFMCMSVGAESKVEMSPLTPVIQVEERKFYRKRKTPGTCVIRMGGLGDLIILSSSLRELKRRSDKPLTMATLKQNVPFMKSLGLLDRVISIEDVDRYRFDNVIDLRFKTEPPQMGSICKGTWEDYTLKDRSDVFDELVGVYPAPKRFDIPIDPAATRRMAEILNISKNEKTVLLNCSMVAAARSIIPKYVKPLCKLITKKMIPRANVVLCGASQPWNLFLKDISGDGIINLIDLTTTPELISLCYLSDLIVTPDTGTLHIAGALGKRTLALFGDISPRTRISYYPNVRALHYQGALPCCPCGDLHPCMGKPEIGSKCMQILKPEIIARAIEEEFMGVKNYSIKELVC